MATGDFALKVPQMREAAALYRAGLSLRQVGDRFGVSQTAVINALRSVGQPLREKVSARRCRLAGKAIAGIYKKDLQT